jgi:hypothetical protein
VISPSQGRYLHIGKHKHRINAHTDIHALSGIRIHDSTVRASEDDSCLRPRGHCDRLLTPLAHTNRIECYVIRTLPVSFRLGSCRYVASLRLNQILVFSRTASVWLYSGVASSALYRDCIGTEVVSK